MEFTSYVAIFAIGGVLALCHLTVAWLGLTIIARVRGRAFNTDRLLETWLGVALITLACAYLLGCAPPKAPCMTGFELGVNGSQSKGAQFGADWDEDQVGGHATVYFDTTGACRTID